MDVVTSLNIITWWVKIILFEHYKTGKLHSLLMSLKLNSLQKIFFQNKGFHFYYCNYCGGCLNGMTEENIQAHLNDCSQHSSKFICRGCGMVSENFLWHMHFFLFSIQNLFYLFKTKFLKNYSHCFFRAMKHLTWTSNPYLQRETMKKWSKRMMKWWREQTRKLKLKNVS